MKAGLGWRAARGVAVCVVLSIALTGCGTGKHVSEKTDPSTLGEDVGYVAFRYDRTGREKAALDLRHAGTGEEYRFELSKAGNMVYLTVASIPVYEKVVSDTGRRTLTLMPLPAGDYEYERLRVSTPLPAWQAFLMQQSSAYRTVPLKGRTVRVSKDSVTYIGTFLSRAKATVFGNVNYAVTVTDDGAVRADSLGIGHVLRTELLEIP